MQKELSWKDGDVYRWSWCESEYNKRKDLANLYWCESQIAIVRGDFLEDTFWSGGCQSRCFKKDAVQEMLSLIYLGNINDYTPCRKEDQAMYDDKDFLNLTHANNRGEYYLKVGAVKSKEKMIKVTKRNALKLRYKLESAKRAFEWEIEKLKNTEQLEYAYGIEDVSLDDNSYFDEDFYLLDLGE